MKSKAKILLLMVISLVFVSIFSFSVSAAKVIESWKSGYGVYMKLYDDGTLKITGNGALGFAESVDNCIDNYKSIKRIEIGEGITDIESECFYGVENVIQITYPKSMTNMSHAYYSRMQGIESYTIPANIKGYYDAYLSDTWHEPCDSTYVKNIFVEAGNKSFKSIDGVLFSYDGKTLIRYPDGRTDTSYVIPEGVTKIGYGAFSRSGSLKSITIPSTVTEIEGSAFENTAIETLAIPEGVTEFRDSCVLYCKSLTSISLPSTIEKIVISGSYGDRVPYSVNTINISKDNSYFKSMDGVVFTADGKKLVWFPAGKDDEIYLVPSSVTTIGASSFTGTSVKCILLPRSINEIEDYAFSCSTALNSIYIPENIIFTPNRYGDYDYSYNIFGADAMFPDIPKNMTVYGFAGSSIEEFLKNNALYNGMASTKVPFVPITEEEYQSKFNGLLSGTFPNGVTYNLGYNYVLTISGTGAIPDFAAGEAPWFAYADKIHTVIIEDGVTSIGACAFYGCRNIYSLSLPGSITSIGYAAFHGCCGLSGFIVPQNVTAIGDYAFFGCTGLKYVTLYPGISYIGTHAFDGCTALERINLPDTITYIGDYAFSGCVLISEIVILVKVVVHSKVSIIDYTSFCGCICHIHGYNDSYAQKYAQALQLSFVPLKFIWAENSEWGTEELKKADELELFPENLKEKDLSQSITREEFASVAVKVYERLTGTSALPAVINPFTDTNNVDVLKAYNVGITTGVSETEFAPNVLLTREQAATMLTRVFKKATIPGWTVDTDANYPLNYDTPTAFADDEDISSWAKESVYFMVSNGIVGGIGNNLFAPKNTTTEQEATAYANATREQALIIAVRMVEKLCN